MKIPWLSLAFTALVLYLAATRLDLAALYAAFTRVDPVFLALALGAWFLILLCKALKWQSMVKALGGGISIFESAQILLIGLFVGVITPGRVGDFVRAAYVKDSIGLGKGIMGVFLDRVMDVLTLLAFAGLGVLELAAVKGIHLISNEVLAGIFVVFGVVLYLSLKRKVARAIWPLVQRVLPRALAETGKKYGSQFYDSVPLLKKKWPLLAGTFILTAIAWVFTVTFGYFLLQGAGIPLDWKVALLTVPVLALVEIIPLGVAGVGTRELAAVIVLGAYGVPPETAIVFSLLYFAMGYIPSFVLGALAFNQKPLPIEGGVKGLLSRLKDSKSEK